ncbi:DUF1045 domain-containing protein [Acidihalobacter prosperus]|uniref:DUF1045 domain-containing protein n=1 Tax=Acidihalobacter prosperus TaxID=160660 RepID=UPI0038B238B5
MTARPREGIGRLNARTWRRVRGWAGVVLGLGLLAAGGCAMANGKVIAYDVFLIPGDGLRPLVQTLARQLSAQGLHPLYAQGYLPHVTLYLTDYPSGRLPEIERRVRALAAHEPGFDMRLGRIVATPSHWLLLQVGVNRRMRRLADAVTRALDPLRVSHPPMPGWVRAYPEKQAVFRRWGSPNVFAQFQPHLTLLTPADPARIASFMRGPGGHFAGGRIRAVGIGIAEVDAHGQAHRVLLRVPFAP